LAWSIASSLWVFPHSLSYFNELAGGPTGGHAHLIHSNIDWGQDLLYLRRWLRGHPEAQPLYLAFGTAFDPRQAGIKFAPPPCSPGPNGRPRNASRLPSGWYAISVNYLRGYPWSVADGEGGAIPVPRNALRCFLDVRPKATAGYSIHIYQITETAASCPKGPGPGA
jgi:hypothetical protein